MNGLSFLNNLITGISLGSVYAIIALGYTMVYGIAKMLNFAHGDVIMVGAYVTFFATGSFNLPPVVGVLLSVVVCTVLGVVIEGLAYRPLRQASSLAVLITAIGVSYFLQNAALLLWGADTKVFTPVVPSGSLPIEGVTITYASLITVLACIVIMLALTWFTSKTKMGKAMRACSEDKAAAQLMGINVNRTISMTFAIGSALAAIASALLFSSYNPELAGPLLSTLGLATVFVCMMLVCNSILQAHGFVTLPVIVMLAGGAVKIFTNYTLVVLPGVGIFGAPTGNILCFGLCLLLDLIIISRVIPHRPRYLPIFVKPLIASALMGGAAWAVYGLLSRLLTTQTIGGEAVLSWTGNAVSALAAILVAVAVYGALVVALRCLSREDLSLMPKGDKIARLLRL